MIIAVFHAWEIRIDLTGFIQTAICRCVKEVFILRGCQQVVTPARYLQAIKEIIMPFNFR